MLLYMLENDHFKPMCVHWEVGLNTKKHFCNHVAKFFTTQENDHFPFAVHYVLKSDMISGNW